MSEFDSFNEPELEKMAIKAINKMFATQKRREKRFNKAVNLPFSLSDGLELLTKEELHIIRKKFDIEGYHLNKPELVSCLKEMLPLRVSAYIAKLDQERYDFIRLAIRNNGIIPSEIIPYEAILYFESTGYFFPGNLDGEEVLLMPHEMVAVFNQIDEFSFKAKVKQNTLWKDVAAGMAHFYGIIEVDKAIAIISELTGDASESFKQKFVSSLYQTDRIIPAVEVKIIKKRLYLVSSALQDPHWLLNEHNSRPEISFYPFTLEEFIEGGRAEVYVQNEYVLEFLDFLQWHFELDFEEALDVVEEIQCSILMGSMMPDLLQELDDILELGEQELVAVILPILVNIFNTSRSWVIKGYSPELLAEKVFKKSETVTIPLADTGKKKSGAMEHVNNVVSIQSARKPGRNEICKCGSGKKYKYCCGKNT